MLKLTHAGKLRTRIVIESPPTDLTPAGELDEAGGWIPVVSTFAEVRPLSGRELQLAREIYADVDMAVSIRYHPGIMSSMRIRLPDDSLLNIIDVRNYELRNRQIDMLCQTGESNAVIGTLPSIAVRSTDIDDTLLSTDVLLLCTSGVAGITITLLSAVGRAGRRFTIKKVDSGAGAVAIVTVGGETIDDLSEWDLVNSGQFVELQSDGENWQVVGVN